MSNPKVELHIANHGVITLELDAAKAPKSAANFLNYVKKGHYDGTDLPPRDPRLHGPGRRL
jgi:peptidyl-prolyl cis-trans isomerase B (cyclophilin B)